MARYVFRQAPGGATPSGPISLGNALATKKNARLKTAPPPPTFQGNIRGQKEVIKKSTGKEFAPDKFFKNMKLMNAAIKNGESTFTDVDGRERNIGKITSYQKYGARHWTDPYKVTAKEGVHKIDQAVIADARLLKQKLREGLNIDSAYQAATTMEKLAAVKPDDKMQAHKEALANLHARLTPDQPPAAAPGMSKPTGTPMTFMEPTPLPTGSGRTPIPRYSSPSDGRLASNITPPGGHGRSIPGPAEPAPIAPLTGTGAEASVLPASSSSTLEPSAPAQPVFQEPEPLTTPPTSIPAVPAGESLGDAYGGSGDEE